METIAMIAIAILGFFVLAAAILGIVTFVVAFRLALAQSRAKRGL